MTQQVVWLQDVSLEVLQPGFIHTEQGSRQLQINVSRQSAPLSNGEDIRLDMRLICHILSGEDMICIADISAASFVKKTQFEQNAPESEQQVYHYIREALGGLLQMAHYTPPLPESLDQIK